MAAGFQIDLTQIRSLEKVKEKLVEYAKGVVSVLGENAPKIVLPPPTPKEEKKKK